MMNKVKREDSVEQTENYWLENLSPQFTTLIIVIVAYALNGPAYPFVGNIVWLPLGAMSLCFLLFGFRVVLAALLATQLSEFWFQSQPFFDQGTLILNVFGVIGPIVAIASMRFFKLSNFFDGSKLIFQHLVFLAILTAFFNTIISFFVTSFIASNDSSIEPINATLFIKNFLIGDILGCLIVLLFAAIVVVPLIQYFFPRLVPSE